MGDAATAEPTFVRIFNYRRLTLDRVLFESITHAYIHTASATITAALVEIDMIERHCMHLLSSST
jgi:hypothetical protein